MGLRKTKAKPLASASPAKPPSLPRIESLDLARGIAITLMILSHGVVGLVPFESLAGWPLVPLHLLTKFSSTLFFLIFGVALGLFFVPKANEEGFSKKRNQLIFRGLEILVWYKILTFIQMFQIYDRQTIMNTLLYLGFPDFAEVLGFYGIFLLWFPVVMPLWAKLNPPLQLAVVVLLAWSGLYLTHNSDFFGYPNIKAILVEQKGYYTFGQFQRGALVLFGAILGRQFFSMPAQHKKWFPLILITFGATLFGVFSYVSYEDFSRALINVASNVGKHPPELEFMLFSGSGAFVIWGLAMFFKSKVHAILKPFVWIGQNSLQAFVFHIFIIFVGYRYLLDLRHKVEYSTALGLTVLLIFLTMLWCLALKIKAKK